jgi:hypothetical protein
LDWDADPRIGDVNPRIVVDAGCDLDLTGSTGSSEATFPVTAVPEGVLQCH